jgi:hypothetical protein
MKLPATQDSGLNMTPMIDIVFQLILFFLFNLRFKSLDWRIESNLPLKEGIQPNPRPEDILPHIRLALVRLDVEDPLRARTKLKLAGSEWVLPAAIPANEAARETLFRTVEERIRSLALTIRGPGEIDCPMPSGGSVPHADVVRAIDAFLAAGITDVKFEGARSPLPKRRSP